MEYKLNDLPHGHMHGHHHWTMLPPLSLDKGQSSLIFGSEKDNLDR